MMIAMGSSCGRLSITLSTLFRGSSVPCGMGGGAGGCGAACVAAGGASGDAGVWGGFRLHPASTMRVAPMANILATETLMAKQDLVQGKPDDAIITKAARKDQPPSRDAGRLSTKVLPKRESFLMPRRQTTQDTPAGYRPG